MELLETILNETKNGNIKKDVAVKIIKGLQEIREVEKSNKDIAIIGIAMRFPGANSADEYFNLFCEKMDCIRPFPKQRKADVDSYFAQVESESEKKKYLDGAYLERIDYFDNELFHIMPNEAKLMDPNQRLFLQVAYEAIEDSGEGASSLSNTKTGVFVGCASNIKDNYQKIIYDMDRDSVAVSIAGNIPAMIPARVAYYLDLKGPAITLDTACSSSLVSVYQACLAINNGDCDYALAGAIKLQLVPIVSDVFKLGIESSDGRTRAFDDISDGAGIGEGVACVLLKPLDKAIKERNSIYAVIKGGAINQDGKSLGITAPNPLSQKMLILKAWEDAKINPEKLRFIETHGTGTPLGDPIEIQGITTAFQERTDKKQFCAISTVKSNIGHMYECSGMGSLIKAVLCLQNQVIPPTNLFQAPNRKINFEDSPVYVNTKVRNISSDEPIICGVSAFGFSGTNCHLVLEEAAKVDNTSRTERKSVNILPISAGSKKGLHKLVVQYLNYFEQTENADLLSMCYTASVGRDHHNYRIAIAFHSVEECISQLNLLKENCLKSNESKKIFYGNFVYCKHNQKTENNELTIAEKMELDKSVKQYSLADVEALCRLYVKGADIDWKALYQGEKCYYLHLPVYPFEEKRFWITESKNGTGLEDYYYQMKWKKCEEFLFTEVSRKNIAIISDNLDARSSLTSELSKKNNITEYSDSEHFQEAIKDLVESDIFDTIMYFCNGQDEEVYSIFSLFKDLEKLKMKCELIAITKNGYSVCGNEKVDPMQAASGAFISSLEKESDFIKTKSLDLGEKINIDTVMQIINWDSGKAYCVREDTVYEQELEGLNFEQGDCGICENGVYVITGGLGGIALEIANYLSQKKHVNIFLLCRNLDKGKKDWQLKMDVIERINQSGSAVYLKQVDVSEQKQMEFIINNIRIDYGKINGVFHCAGVMSNSYLVDKTVEDIKEVFLPKVQGTRILDQIFSDNELDFMVLCSSIATAFGGPSQLDYISANTYLNAVAQKRNSMGLKTFSINWSTWKETGMSYSSGFTMDTIFKALPTEKALACLDNLLHTDGGNVIVGCLNKNKSFIQLLLKSKYELSPKIRGLVDEILRDKKQEEGIVGKGTQNNVVLKGKETFSAIDIAVGEIVYKVLGIDCINIYDNFFELGVDSILLRKIQQGVEEKFKLTTKMSEMFQNLSISKLSEYVALKIQELKNEEEVNAEEEILVSDEQEYYLSSQQKRIYILSCMDNDSKNYNIFKAVTLKGKLDVSKLSEAIKVIIGRHESLRTSFVVKEDQVVQVVHKNVEFQISEKYADKDDLDRYISDAIGRFDLEVAPLVQLSIIHISELEYVAVFNMHHIIGDGASISVILNELSCLYSNIQLDEQEYQYIDYVKSQEKLQQSKEYSYQKQFWIDSMQSATIKEISTDFKRTEDYQSKGKLLYRVLDEELTEKIKFAASKQHVTPFVFLLSAFSVVISKMYANANEVIIGTPILGRTDEKFENVIGYFVNTLAIRVPIVETNTYHSFVNELQETCSKIFDNQDYQFDDLVDELKIPRSVNRNPIFDVFFSLQNVGLKNIVLEGLEADEYKYNAQYSRFDLSLDISQVGEKLGCIFEYRTDLFKEETIDKCFTQFENVLKKITDSMEFTLAEFSFEPAVEAKKHKKIGLKLKI